MRMYIYHADGGDIGKARQSLIEDFVKLSLIAENSDDVLMIREGRHSKVHEINIGKTPFMSIGALAELLVDCPGLSLHLGVILWRNP